MSSPLGFILTWACYGQRLHGDVRGTVNDQRNGFGTPKSPPSERLRIFEASLLRHEPIELSSPMRLVVHATIMAHAAHRDWNVHALNVRTNHVHVVLSGDVASPMRAEGEFKAWATRRLREQGLVMSGARVWARQGSAKWIWNDRGWFEAIAYVLHEQGADLDDGLPRSLTEWRARAK